jgi:hypothetical protein
MTDLAEKRARWRALGIKVFVRRAPDGEPRLRAKVPPGAATPEVLAELAEAKPALLAILDDGRSDRERRREREWQYFRERLALIGEPPEDRSWRKIVACWPDVWRRRWGIRANRREDRGQPWNVAEWRAFWDTSWELIAAEERGEVPAESYPDVGPEF